MIQGFVKQNEFYYAINYSGFTMNVSRAVEQYALVVGPPLSYNIEYGLAHGAYFVMTEDDSLLEREWPAFTIRTRLE